MELSIGIAGFGVTGQALHAYLHDQTKHTLIINDPPKNIDRPLAGCSVVFVCVPVPTDFEKGQDLSMVKDVIEKCDDDALIVIRSTILPGTTKALAQLYDKTIVHVPEFLTARRATQDQFDAKIIYVGADEIDPAYKNIFEMIFPEKQIRFVSSGEAEMIKYAHNVFGAMKVTYWNAVHEFCEKRGLHYNTVRLGCLSVTDFINPEHTKVPGPDGFKGFGGTCFPVNVEGAASTASFGFRMFGRFIRDLNRIYRKEFVDESSTQRG